MVVLGMETFDKLNWISKDIENSISSDIWSNIDIEWKLAICLITHIGTLNYFFNDDSLHFLFNICQDYLPKCLIDNNIDDVI